MKIKYFQRGDGYIAVTSQCPKGFNGVLYVGKGGPLGSIIEEAFEVGQLRKLRSVQLSEVPDEWVIALGYDKPEPEPEEPEVFDTILDDEGENLVAILPRPRRTRRQPIQVQAPVKNYDIWFFMGMAIGAIIGVYILTQI